MVTRIILVFNDIGFFEVYSVVVDLHIFIFDDILDDAIERWACVLPAVTMSQSVGSRRTMFLVHECRVG